VGTSVDDCRDELHGGHRGDFIRETASLYSNLQYGIQTTVPAGAATGPLSVTTPAETATSASSFAVAPTITSFTPSSGRVGTSVTISGRELHGGNGGDVQRERGDFTVTSDTAIQTTVPAGATTGPLSVTTPAGTALSASKLHVDGSLDGDEDRPPWGHVDIQSGRIACGSTCSAISIAAPS